jgi:glutamyl-tRNA reductase
MNAIQELHLLGVSFRTASAPVRETWHFSAEEALALLRRAADAWPRWEAAILSTCVRTEIYVAAPADAPAVKCWLALLRERWPGVPPLGGRFRRYTRRGWEVADHLFRVTCGLDSAIRGDVQVLGQVKAARSMAAEAGTLGKSLQQTFQQAVTVGRRARAETAISWGSAGIGSALAGWLAARCQPSASGRPVEIVLLGAGEAAWDIAHHLRKRGVGALCFLNRTEARAAELAGRCAGRVRPWHALAEALVEADVVIAATAAPEPVLSRGLLEEVMRRRQGRPLLVVDAGLPRNVEAGSSAEVVDIDALREQQEAVRQQREAAVPAVEALVAEELLAWQRWRAALPLETLIKHLYQEADRRCHDAAEQLAATSALSLERAEHLVAKAVKQLLHRHVRGLRGWAGHALSAPCDHKNP